MSLRTRALPWPSHRRPADPFRDVDGDGFFVFVPAIMSVGVVFSIVTLIRDAFRWTGSRARERRTILEARAVIHELIGTPEVDDPSHSGLLSRRAYVGVAITSASAAIYLAVWSVASYLRDGGSVQNIAWLLSLTLLVAGLLGLLSVISAVVAQTWPAPPSWTHATLRNAPLTVDPRRVGLGPPASLSTATLAATLVTIVVTLMVVTGRGLAKSIDQPIVDWLTTVDWLDRLGVVDPFGSTLVTIAFVALIGLSSFRCRVMAAVYPVAFVLAWITVEVLQDVVDRTRPDGFDAESFPSGHMVQVVFIAGLLPPALRVLFSNRRLVLVSRAVLVTAVVATGVHRIHLAKHWPVDILAGLSIGATVVLAAHWVLHHQVWHQECPSCPWSPHPGSVPWRRGVINLRSTTARGVGLAGSLIALAAAAGLGAATLWVGLPQDPEGSGLGSAISGPVQLGLAALMAAAGFAALRWKAVPAMAMAVAAVGLGVFASVQYQPLLAFLLALCLLAPAFLTWLSWQPTATLGSIATVAALTAATLTGTALGAREVHEHYFGPTHPSSLAAPLVSDADWLWLGGVDHDSATITAGGFTPSSPVDLQYWVDGQSNTDSLLLREFADEYGLVRFGLENLALAATYHYRVLDTHREITTQEPSESNASFRTFALGARTLRSLSDRVHAGPRTAACSTPSWANKPISTWHLVTCTTATSSPPSPKITSPSTAEV